MWCVCVVLLTHPGDVIDTPPSWLHDHGHSFAATVTTYVQKPWEYRTFDVVAPFPVPPQPGVPPSKRSYTPCCHRGPCCGLTSVPFSCHCSFPAERQPPAVQYVKRTV